MKNFEELNLPTELNIALKKMNFNEPTPIQKMSIPHALLGKDILGSAETGTGKTGAFGIPLINKLLTCPESSALILTPTRELATQVKDTMTMLANGNKDIKIALLIGGDPIGKQLSQLQFSPRIIVGTPGRINDHIKRKTLKLHNTNFLVLDETDRMLDMGFEIQLETILQMLPKHPLRQTLLFSATIPNNILKISEKYLNNPERILTTTHATPPVNITQENVPTSESDKYHKLTEILEKYQGPIIIFAKTKRGADQLATKLNYENYSSAAIHGDLRQSKRERIIQGFRKSKYQILVATDLAARGLDIPNITCVVNYDLPQCPEDYIHRIGRTARAGAKGIAINLITSADQKKWRDIERLISTNESSSADRGRDFAKKPSFPKNNRNSGNFADRDRWKKNNSSPFETRKRSFSNPVRSDKGKPENRFNAKPSFARKDEVPNFAMKKKSFTRFSGEKSGSFFKKTVKVF